jgi:uncharacterized OB-fold protein
MSKGLALHWRLIPQRYNLIGTECVTCKTKFFPKRSICPNCRRRSKIREIKYSGRGKVYSYTVIHAPPDGFELLKPYVLAIIKLEEGPLVTAQIADADPDEVDVGSKVELVFRKISSEGSDGIIKYGYKFKLRR